MRALLSLVVVCALLALASAAMSPPQRTHAAAPGAGGLQSCKPETLNAMTDKAQRLAAIRVCVNAFSKNEKLTLYHYGPQAQWTTWATPGMDIPMNQLGFNAFRYSPAYKSHAKNAASLAPKERPSIRLDRLKATENECWDYPLDKAGSYNRYNCVAQHRAKFFDGLAVKYKTNKSFAKGYAVAKTLGTAKLTWDNEVMADSMGAGIYYCPSAKFLEESPHGDTLSECTFTDASPLKVFNIDEHTADGKTNLKWMEDVKMFAEESKSKQMIAISGRKFKNRFTNQADVEAIFNFHPTGNIAVRYRAGSNLKAFQPPYYVLKRFDFHLCKLSPPQAAAPAQAPANANAPAPAAPANANPGQQRGRSNTV